MKKKYFMVIIPFVLGISCFIIYNIIGTHVAPDGMLIEPFFLLPIGRLCIIIGIVWTIILRSTTLFRKK